jgi:hypothetical protein
MMLSLSCVIGNFIVFLFLINGPSLANRPKLTNEEKREEKDDAHLNQLVLPPFCLLSAVWCLWYAV